MGTILDRTAPVLGVMISEFANPNLVRIFQQAGFQYAIIDDEHGYFDFSQLAALVGVANGFGFPVIVRVPGVSRAYITKVLDMGANGILVPMVNTAQQARQVISCSKYTPVGNRGISTTRAHTNYNPPPLQQYLKSANQNTLTFLQLETRQAIQNAQEIACVEGVDGIFIGPNDLAGDLGVPGQVADGQVLSAVEQVAQIAHRLHKPAGIITTNPALTQFCRRNGFSLYSSGSELDLLLSGARARVNSFFGNGPA